MPSHKITVWAAEQKHARGEIGRDALERVRRGDASLDDVVAEALAGLVERKRRRHTGTVVSIYLAEPAGLDTAGGRYAAVCEDHSTICNFERLAEARRHAPVADWCEECTGVAPAREEAESLVADDLDRKVAEAIELEERMAGELAGVEDGFGNSLGRKVERRESTREEKIERLFSLRMPESAAPVQSKSPSEEPAESLALFDDSAFAGMAGERTLPTS